MAARKNMSKKLRFEVFKRDGFTCQYCGNHPPAVILEPDHINPVCNGGTNAMDNLVTACFDCNRGKAGNLLSSVPQSLKEKAAEVAEKEAQIRGYQEVMMAKESRIREDIASVEEVFGEYFPNNLLPINAQPSIGRFIELLGLYEVRDSMRIACTARNMNYGRVFKYFCGVCWNKARGASHG